VKQTRFIMEDITIAPQSYALHKLSSDFTAILLKPLHLTSSDNFLPLSLCVYCSIVTRSLLCEKRIDAFLAGYLLLLPLLLSQTTFTEIDISYYSRISFHHDFDISFSCWPVFPALNVAANLSL